MANVYMGHDVEDFIFGEGTVYEENTTVVEEEVEEITDEELNAHGVIECVDEPEVACYRIALENEMNYNAIMNAFMMKEFSVLESTGEEMVYEAVDVKKFFGWIKEQVGKFWAKVQGVFKSIMDKIADYVVYHKAFVKKYKDKPMVEPTKAKEFQGFNFKLKENKPLFLAITKTIQKHVKPTDIMVKSEAEANQFVENFKAGFENTKSYMRGNACGNSTAVADNEYEKALKVAFFGSEEKVKITKLPAFAELIKDLEDAKDAKNSAKLAYSEAKSAVKELQKDIKDAESKLAKGDAKTHGMKVARCLTDAINASLTIMSKSLSVYTKAIMTKVSQDRAMAAFYVQNQPASAKTTDIAVVKNESAIDDMDIVLI